MAPELAWLPYNAVASGPFNTVIDSISLGFKSAIRLVLSIFLLLPSLARPTPLPPCELELKVVLSAITPSITNKGWLVPDIELKPLRIIPEEAPAVPVVGVTLRPATLPCSAFTKFSLCVSAISAPLTVWMEYPSSLGAFLISMAVTTTSSMVPSFSIILIVTLPPSFTLDCWLPKLTELNTNTSPALAVMVKFPFASVLVPVAAPFTSTEAPTTGLPFSSSTLPVTGACACDNKGTRKNRKAINLFVNFLI